MEKRVQQSKFNEEIKLQWNVVLIRSQSLELIWMLNSIVT